MFISFSCPWSARVKLELQVTLDVMSSEGLRIVDDVLRGDEETGGEGQAGEDQQGPVEHLVEEGGGEVRLRVLSQIMDPAHVFNFS